MLMTGDRDSVTVEHLQEMATWGIKRSRDRWRHVPWKVKVIAPIYFDVNIWKTVEDRGSVAVEHKRK